MPKFYQLPGYLFKITITLSFFVTTVLHSFSQINLGFTDLVNAGLSSPVDIANDGTTRLFIVEQTGAIRIYNGGTLVTTPFINLAGRISCCGERGLLSLAFHPQYSSNGFFYVYYTAVNTGNIVLERFKTDPANANTADPATGKILLTIPHTDNSNHNGGHLAFGTDNYLYFATGDGGGAGDPPDNAQDIGSLLGKMLRINPTTNDIAPYYTIPPDNPYLGTPTSELIWAIGLRNPFRWSFDRANGNMWIADVGQNQWEEVNRVNAVTPGGITPPNLNYGWDCMEGTRVYADPSPRLPCGGTYVTPVLDYDHTTANGGFSITGGYVYRGSAYPALLGYYIFADYVTANVWLLPPNGTAGDTIMYRNLRDSITSFGENASGELFATTLNGRLFQVVAPTNIVPVNLISFAGSSGNGSTQLIWETQNEINVQQYEIESSTNGTDFNRVGIVTAKNSNSYRFTHNISGNIKIYYRLRILDLDGKFEYSKIIQIAPSNSTQAGFVTPSVIRNNMLNLFIQGSYHTVQMVSLEGKEVWRQNISARTGNLRYSIPSLKPGNYLVRLIGNEKILTQKILIQ
ncbi:MAG: PQQ-dependent sugar dehydrogenase [Chitinophagaceae bacterium]|nr:PQQ-dependent sugar dehydrogenase [Chitinophagaceae bacterium]